MGDFDGKIRLAGPEDARAITRLIEECYRGTHPIAECRDPASVSRTLEDGSVVYGIAVTPEGRQVGQAALERRGGAGLYEYCRAVVDDGFRGCGLLGAISNLLLREKAAEVGARFVIGRPVTTHLYTQLDCKKKGFAPVGLLLGLFPTTIVASGIAPPEQPASALIQAIRIERESRQRKVTLEGRDGERALEVLASLGVPALQAMQRPAPTAPMGAHFERDRNFGVVNLRFTTSAPPRRLHAGFIEGLEAAGTRIIWADVPVEDPDAPRVIERLRELGLGWGAYLPLAGPKGEDVVRFQRYLDPIPLRREAILVMEDVVSLRDEILAESHALEAVA